jgi:hypothetical protein
MDGMDAKARRRQNKYTYYLFLFYRQYYAFLQQFYHGILLQDDSETNLLYLSLVKRIRELQEKIKFGPNANIIPIENLRTASDLDRYKPFTFTWGSNDDCKRFLAVLEYWFLENGKREYRLNKKDQGLFNSVERFLHRQERTPEESEDESGQNQRNGDDAILVTDEYAIGQVTLTVRGQQREISLKGSTRAKKKSHVAFYICQQIINLLEANPSRSWSAEAIVRRVKKYTEQERGIIPDVPSTDLKDHEQLSVSSIKGYLRLLSKEKVIANRRTDKSKQGVGYYLK